ncbi:DUF418 domain-containing protein [Geomicrobium sp. JCM 19039]|uniref:DUF418 domain-containing protein n=1 Tax=Geomicrobium sp. JCM 19039 TaxID=1460636 RepID=UPI00045F3B39|nr:DUF418 domain-containing protein [Geomicrobium sp. JCM 19039]GAK13614.1 hypothetical protein JCM19039_3475 [Geomicrobium sp. JCM 19039]
MNSASRLHILDLLRGVAIVGTLATNIWIFSNPGSATLMPMDQGQSVVEVLQSVFVNGNFLAMLTILFGVGLYMKYQNSKASEVPWIPFYLLTMFILFIEGLFHFVFIFEYDILMTYAITGAIVAFLVQLKTKTITIWVIVTLSLHTFGILIYYMQTYIAFSDPTLYTAIQQIALETTSLYQFGTYFEQVLYRIENFFLLRSEAFSLIYGSIGLYLIGIRLYLAGAFNMDKKGILIQKKLMFWGFGIGLPLNLLSLVPGGYFEIPVRFLFAPVLTIGYIGLIAWLMNRGALRWIQKQFEVIGRTALSCYVLQSILASLYFYSFGLGFIGVDGILAVVVGVVLISICMLGFAHLTLKTFGVGPLEWLWKTLSKMPFKNRRYSAK